MAVSLSTETEGSKSEFAAAVLRNLLAHITEENAEGADTFEVSHAWTDGPTMYLVYKAPPSAITWGLVRDTRESIIYPAPWPSLKEAVRYYYLLDLCENRVSASFPHPGNDPEVILWHGDQLYNEDSCEGLPQRSADIPDQYRYTHPPLPAENTRPPN
ncbi:hypothetical protein [Mycolicibacterium palauense]|uniref:hypothetical protein n=1 Tax=Mycolicibacterium palauense TaxID=2034511 RepID=UPI001FE917EB|nr:hypothetical protein [Mycolicibacterium palauense]